jgi:hypothetical protein
MDYVGVTKDGRDVELTKLDGAKWKVRIGSSTHVANTLPRMLRYLTRHTSELPFIAEYTTQMSKKGQLINNLSDVLLLEPSK